MSEFSHLDEGGEVRMVDVSSKPGTLRVARASGYIAMRPETMNMLQENRVPKGNVLTTAKVAGIQAAKQTAHLIPLCHQLNLSFVDIGFAFEAGRILISASVSTRESTGVEMEALTAVTVAALTIYDMCKAVDRSMEIGGVRLEAKKGGKTGLADAPRPKAAVLVVSDSVSAGRAEDRSGTMLLEGLAGAGCAVEPLGIVPDEPTAIVSAVDGMLVSGVELLVTTGGTGLGPRDVTVDALLPKFTRRLPGVEQALFQWGQGKVRTAMLSRLAAGTIGDCVVICLPGSRGAAADALEVLLPTIFHAFDMIRGGGH
ncbi:bifunctional molybdenum cofactor biosynthesis protein MoaC/MoaB [Prosthecochloris sp. GSB1]|uniref:bifunctional molybdenum cofactor biosynthesis protein MoaC/MoaB n=1 Tax=Prosthecochloris sp. GSB1 TaxID=281093 RepID=UPI000B8CE53F|nr:bifunctional molybdenum cofactor biosynthesis protein MoaC/MoaB [Prosthecochloris sp. GSB1]ASQ91394.1 bifunctional molybdenum cofactor biosynthesis protein MoaC/MoaB [Prosthecochloris sp. GSB1]